MVIYDPESAVIKRALFCVYMATLSAKDMIDGKLLNSRFVSDETRTQARVRLLERREKRFRARAFLEALL